MARQDPVSSRIGRIALIGNYLPRKCGIATFTCHCHSALRERFPEIDVRVYAMEDRLGGAGYPPEVVDTIPENDRGAYLEAARDIEDSGCEAVWVQHEYGIFGGRAGEYILALLERLHIPVIVTLHTILEEPDDDQRRVLERLIEIAGRVVVMAEKGAEILRRVYDAPADKIVVIPHGAPDRALEDPDAIKPRFGFEGRKVALTFGLLAPNKGIETMIAALPEIVETHPDLLYVVLGTTHPNLVAREGERYRDSLIALAEELDVAEHLIFVDEFADQERVLDYLQAADIYVTPYLNPAQITSGTLSYAIALGKPIVSTPYLHAAEALADNHGVLLDFGDAPAFARSIGELLSDDAARAALSMRAYERGRTTLWPRLAERMVDAIGTLVARQPARIAPRGIPDRPIATDLRAVIKFTDGTGILQHGVYGVPDRAHGYCVDDNARALILMTRVEHADPDEQDRLTATYASFVQHAWNPDTRRFRNFMSYDRAWLEEQGSEDSFGRSLWSLGIAARDAGARRYRRWGAALFDEAVEAATELDSLRARAFAMLGAAAMLDAHPGHKPAMRLIEDGAERLSACLAASRRSDWTWFESVLAYDNCRLPEALLAAGRALGRDDFTENGLTTLDWILGQQISPANRFRAVGTDSFGRDYAPPLPFDQQPLEAQGAVEACAAAHEATGDPRWIEAAKRAYGWYFGINDLGLPLLSRQDGGCHDGLEPNGINLNQGAESILAFQLATATMARLPRVAHSYAGAGVAAE